MPLTLRVFPSTAQPDTGFQYAVKFICGKADGRFLAPGVYFTAINVHNPSRAVSSFLKKVASTLTGERTGRVSPFFEARLQADEALEIECPDILQHAQNSPSPIASCRMLPPDELVRFRMSDFGFRIVIFVRFQFALFALQLTCFSADLRPEHR